MSPWSHCWPGFAFGYAGASVGFGGFHLGVADILIFPGITKSFLTETDDFDLL